MARGGRWRGGWVGANSGVNQFFPRNGGSTRCAHSFNKLLSSPALHGAAPSINFCRARVRVLLCIALPGSALLVFVGSRIALRCTLHCAALLGRWVSHSVGAASCFLLLPFFSLFLLPSPSFLPLRVGCALLALRCIALHSLGDFWDFSRGTLHGAGALFCPRRVFIDCWRWIVQPIHHTFNKLRYLSRSGTDRFVGPQRASSADRNCR